MQASIKRSVFIALFFVILFTLNCSIGVNLIEQNSIKILIIYLFIQIINIGISYRLIELFLSLIVKKTDLRRIKQLFFYPKVALLYVTYNDAIPKYLKELKKQTYTNYDIYVLDDSNEEKFIKLVDSFEYKVLRRTTRSGFKAGSLNNWLRLYGNEYKYFIIADSDSSFENKFIENMVMYAEDETNRNVAIFQSKILPSNLKNSFSKVVGSMIPVSMYFHEKLGNDCMTILSWGHNNLHRTRIIQKIGGFDERFISEDYATSLALIKRGYECKLVDVVSYEQVPETIQSYGRRYLRWAKQTIELRKIDKNGLPFTTKLHLFMGFYSYTVWVIILLGMLIAVWGFSTSSDTFIAIIIYITSIEFLTTHLVAYLIILFYIFDLMIFRLPLAVKLGIPIKDYLKSAFLGISIHTYLIYPLLKAEIKTFFGERVKFEVTEKERDEIHLSFVQVIKAMDFGVLFIVFLSIGLIKNPLFLIFNYFWIIPILSSPIVIYLLQENR